MKHESQRWDSWVHVLLPCRGVITPPGRRAAEVTVIAFECVELCSREMKQSWGLGAPPPIPLPDAVLCWARVGGVLRLLGLAASKGFLSAGELSTKNAPIITPARSCSSCCAWQTWCLWSTRRVWAQKTWGPNHLGGGSSNWIIQLYNSKTNRNF